MAGADVAVIDLGLRQQYFHLSTGRPKPLRLFREAANSHALQSVETPQSYPSPFQRA